MKERENYTNNIQNHENGHQCESSQGGWKPGSYEPTQALFVFYNNAKENALWSSNRDPKAYNNMKN